jgi:hypothetical protein
MKLIRIGHSQGTTTHKRETIYIKTTKHTKKNQARYKIGTTLIGRVDDTQEYGVGAF